MITARTQYDDRPNLKSDLSFEGDRGVTKQSDLKDTDINLIFKRFEKTGQLPDLITKNGRYGDFSAVPDYQEAVQIVRTAEEQFMALDAHVRNRFENDPAKFLAFVTDDKNYDEMEKMGLLKPEIIAERNAKKLADGKRISEELEAQRLAQLKADLEKIKA